LQADRPGSPLIGPLKSVNELFRIMLTPPLCLSSGQPCIFSQEPARPDVSQPLILRNIYAF